MKDANLDSIEKYQKLYEADPKSRVFAPLADGYRKMGMLEEALEVASTGVRQHPHFAGGRVALGRVLMDLERVDLAEVEFKKAVDMAPENLLAYQLLAETQLKQKKAKEALKSFKILLFLNPDNLKAKNAVKKLESLTADEYSEEIFAMKPLREAVKDWDDLELVMPTPNEKQSQQSVTIFDDSDDDTSNAQSSKKKPTQDAQAKFLDRALSLADAYMARHEMDRALEALNEAERLLGPSPEIVRRLKVIHHRQLEQIPHPKNSKDLERPKGPIPSRSKSRSEEQIEILQDLLHKIKENTRSV